MVEKDIIMISDCIMKCPVCSSKMDLPFDQNGDIITCPTCRIAWTKTNRNTLKSEKIIELL